MAESSRPKTLFTHSMYDKLKTTALVVLPTIASAYFVFGTIWGLPKIEEVLGSIAAIEALLGGTLKASSNRYYRTGANFDGDVNVFSDEDGGKHVKMVFNEPPDEVVDQPGKHSMEFKINHMENSES